MKLGGGDRYTIHAKWKGAVGRQALVHGGRRWGARGLFCYVCLLMEGLFRRLKAFLLLFFSMGGGAFCYIFLLMGDLFHSFKGLSATFFLYVEAFLLHFSPYGGTFFTFERPFCYFFSPCGRPFSFFLVGGGGGGFFLPFEGLSATFFLHVGVLFLVLWGPFFGLPPPPPTKILAGAHACVSLNPYE